MSSQDSYWLTPWVLSTNSQNKQMWSCLINLLSQGILQWLSVLEGLFSYFEGLLQVPQVTPYDLKNTSWTAPLAKNFTFWFAQFSPFYLQSFACRTDISFSYHLLINDSDKQKILLRSFDLIFDVEVSFVDDFHIVSQVDHFRWIDEFWIMWALEFGFDIDDCRLEWVKLLVKSL